MTGKAARRRKTPADGTISSLDATLAADVTLSQVRRWSKWHAPYLSPTAQPPAGQPRRYTWRDVEVLKEIRRLREDQGLTTKDVNAKLATFVVVDAPSPAWTATAAASSDTTMPQRDTTAAQDATESAVAGASTSIVPAAALGAIDSRFKAIDSRLDAIQQQAGQRSTDADRLRWLLTGAGLAAAALLAALAALALIVGLVRQ
jgi:DNA-binding transcriptional MerR regulator